MKISHKILTQVQDYNKSIYVTGRKSETKKEDTTMSTCSAINKGKKHYNTQKWVLV